MRSCLALLSFLLPLACSTPTRIVAPTTDRELTIDEVADDLASADVVALGELHQTPAVHATHLALIQALHARRPRMVVAMEMFERDVQTLMLRYLNGFVPETTFKQGARPWPDYDRDYRPVVEFCKAQGLVVLAANAPRKLANQVVTEGLDKVLGNPDVARETTAPDDDYFEAFRAEMQGHPGLSDAKLHAYYAAQCLKDDTMAESIVEHVQANVKAGEKPFVVLVCGKMHSDYGRGTVARIKRRMPQLAIRVLSAETVDDVASGVYQSPRGVADYVVVAPKVARAQQGMPDELMSAPAAKPAASQPAAVAPATPKPAHPPAATGNPHGPAGAGAAGTAPAEGGARRPALGFMPNYSEAGVLVEALREGGPAEQAGLQAGDVIVQLAGQKVGSVAEYQEVLDELEIGKPVAVRILRNGAEKDLMVTVGSRAATR